MERLHYETDDLAYEADVLDVSSDPSPLLSSYPNVSVVDFTSVSSFGETCANVVQHFNEGAGCPYVGFRGVCPLDFKRIEGLRDRRRSSLPRCSFLYDEAEECLIVKLMPSAHHDRVTMEFMRIFEWTLSPAVRPTLAPMGPFKCRSQTGRSKEPDHSYKPASRALASDWPSFVIEVGLSKSLANLRHDLAFWLTQSQRKTRVAVLLHINRLEGTIYIERWDFVPRVCPVRSGVNYGANIGAVEKILLKRMEPYGGRGLSIPAHLIYDVVPPGVVAGEFILSPQDLEGFKNRVWETLG